jgi:2-keto-3-deoxy-L-rhamnonate aldolase RhmA
VIGATLRRRLGAGECVSMINPHHVSSGLAARLCELGADTVFLDCEHGSASFEEVRAMAAAARGAGGGAIVRPANHERSLLIRYLNMGADGLMVPMVDTAEEARAIVDAVRYGCFGTHENRLVVAMVETLQAVENLDAILQVDGIDVFFVGPGDLSQSMGLPPSVPTGERRDPKVVSVVETTLARIRDAGRIPGTLVVEDDIGHFAAIGTRFFYIHSDPFLRSGIRRMKEEAERAARAILS